MKTLKYLIVSLAVIFTLAGCTGSSGSYYDTTMDKPMNNQTNSMYDDDEGGGGY